MDRHSAWPRAIPLGLGLSASCLLLALAVMSSAADASGDTRGVDNPPEGVQQILPRGGIPAVFDPSFVKAGDADIPDDAWVLGVVIDGKARAYSLNLLNHHEVVNDSVDGRPIAAVW